MDKLLSQLSALTGADLTLNSILYAINSAGTVEGKITIQDVADLIASGGGNIKTVEYTVGVSGVTGVDYNFNAAANTTEQAIQLGAGDIIPGTACIINIVAKCTTGLSGVITGTLDMGASPGATDFINAEGIYTTNAITRANAMGTVSNSASSVYASFTPSANWDTITSGAWKFWITYIDNSAL